jgi:hypothetical protein
VRRMTSRMMTSSVPIPMYIAFSFPLAGDAYPG